MKRANTFTRYSIEDRLIILNTCENFMRCTESNPMQWVQRWDQQAELLWEMYYPWFNARAGRSTGRYCYELDRIIKRALNRRPIFKEQDSSHTILGYHNSDKGVPTHKRWSSV